MSKGNILVIDDELILRDLLVDALSDQGYAVSSAQNGEEGLELFKKDHFDMVITDLKMPGMGGLKLVEKTRALDPDAIMVVVTAYGSLESAQEALRLGAYDYITKPFEMEEICFVVKRAISSRRLILTNKKLMEELREQNVLLEDKVKEEARELSLLYKLERELSSTLNLTDACAILVDRMCALMDADICSIMLFDKHSGLLGIVYARGLSSKVINEVRIKPGEGVSGWVFEHRRPILIPDISKDERFADFANKNERYYSNAFISIPLIVKDEPIGVININNKKSGTVFKENEFRFANEAAVAGAVAINNALLYKEVKEEKNKISAIIQSASEGIVVTNERDEIIAINSAAKLLLGIKGRKEMPDGVKKFVFDPIYKELNDSKLDLITKEMDLSYPQSISIRIDMTPLKDETGIKTGVVMLLRDITKRKEVERMKTEFISTVSHELRTPLATMKEFVSIIVDGIAGETTSEQREYLDIIARNINRLSRIINNLLDISKIEAGKMDLKRQVADISVIAEKEMASFKAQLDSKKITLKSDLARDLPQVYVDEDRIIQVFTNLIGNAVKFTPENGTITVATRKKAREIECSVTDTGIGIAEEDREKAFDKFQQIDRVPGSGEKGTGLGLPISRQIVQIHGGNIWVEGDANKGSRFVFTIPIYTRDNHYEKILTKLLSDAERDQISLSFILINVEGYLSLEQKLGLQKAESIMSTLERATAKVANRPGDGVFWFKDGLIFLYMQKTNKEGASVVEGKLKESLPQEVLLQAKEKIDLNFSIFVYPESIKNSQDLFEAMKAYSKN